MPIRPCKKRSGVRRDGLDEHSCSATALGCGRSRPEEKNREALDEELAELTNDHLDYLFNRRQSVFATQIAMLQRAPTKGEAEAPSPGTIPPITQIRPLCTTLAAA